jgi:uncharacterized phage protein gp47/JayE
MPLSIAQVLAGTTTAKTLAFLVDILESLGFVTTSWQEGSVQRNVLEACAESGAGAANTVSALLNNVLVSPQGEWLDFVGVIRYGVERIDAVKTVRVVTFTSSAGAPNHNIDPASLVAANGIRYRTTNTSAEFLGTGLTLDIEIEAEFGGIDGNLPASTALSLQTSYTGVTVAFNGEPITPGVDVEKDDRYWARCQLAPALFTYSSGLRAYELWALTAAPSVERVTALNNYPDVNDVRVVLYPGTAAEIALVEAYVADKHPPNDVVTVSAASVVQQSVVYSPHVPRGTSVSTLNAAIQSAFDAMPIGGILIPGAVAGRLLRETISDAINCNLGARSTGLVTPSADVVLGATDVVQGVFSVTPEYF